ncbi:hypothetical protein L7F22_007966 [Adiantum nelumboides]|nr:hypothetical protein [Adiantum nelumboides]
MMSKPTTTISRTLPDFPYTPGPAPTAAVRKPFSALFSGSHFVTTVVSPSPASNPPPSPPAHLSSCSCSFSDPADLPPELADFFSAQASPSPSSPSTAFPPSSAQAELHFARIESSLLQSSRRPSRSQQSDVKQALPRIFKRPSSSRSTRRLKSTNPSSSPPPLSKYPALIDLGDSGGPVVIESENRGSLTTQRRRKSAWRHLIRMGNRIVAPFRSIGICVTGGPGFCEDRSAAVSSSGSSCYSSGEYPPEYIRAVLENNVLLEHLTLD